MEKGIIAGFSDNTFRPADDCTRLQFTIMIWRLVGKPSSTAAVKFSDISSSASTTKAIRWAVEKGIISGYSDGTFKPENTVTRQQVAIILWRMAGKPAAGAAASFSDVSTSTSGYKAIYWGVNNGLIKGYSDNTFRPTNNCLRQEIAIFLYRYAKNIMGLNVSTTINLNSGSTGSNTNTSINANIAPKVGVSEITIKNNRNQNLVGDVYRPSSNNNGKAVILCHGLGGTATPQADYCEALYKKGFNVFSFDFAGGGPGSRSDGETTDMSVLTEKDDLAAIVNYVKSLDYVNTNKIYLWGHSQGSIVAIMYATEHPEIAGVCMLAPAYVLGTEWAPSTKSEISTGNTVAGTDEYGITWYLGKAYSQTLYDLWGADNPNAGDIIKMYNYSGPVLIIHGTYDLVTSYIYSSRAIAYMPNANISLYQGADHVFSRSSDRTKTIVETIEFCTNH